MKILKKNMLRITAASMLIMAGVFASQAVADEDPLSPQQIRDWEQKQAMNKAEKEDIPNFLNAKDRGEFTGDYHDWRSMHNMGY